MLRFLRSRKKSDPSVVGFVLQVSAKKPTLFCFVSLYKEANLCQLLILFRRSNRCMFVDVFIACVAQSY